MSAPHTCRCEKCGAEGTIIPTSMFDATAAKTIMGNVPIVPTETNFPESPYVSSRADELASAAVGAIGRAYADIPTCAHGYTRCMPCKFPPAKACGCKVPGCTGCGEFP